MVEFKYDENIFNTECEVIVNHVNCVGIMGKGIALQVKTKYPEVFKRYKNICDKNMLKHGLLQIVKTNDKTILNFPTKMHWKNNSKIEWVEEGLIKFVESYKERGIKSIAFPPLGCGNGNLNWEEVKLLMLKYLNNLDIKIEIYCKGN